MSRFSIFYILKFIDILNNVFIVRNIIIRIILNNIFTVRNIIVRIIINNIFTVRNIIVRIIINNVFVIRDTFNRSLFINWRNIYLFRILNIFIYNIFDYRISIFNFFIRRIFFRRGKWKQRKFNCTAFNILFKIFIGNIWMLCDMFFKRYYLTNFFFKTSSPSIPVRRLARSSFSLNVVSFMLYLFIRSVTLGSIIEVHVTT